MDIIIIEDEQPTLRMLKNYVFEIDSNINIIADFDSVESSVNWLKNNEHPDVILMDIQLSDGISFDILKKVEIESMVIFITAFDDYLMQAFSVNSIDYLLKPISKSDLENSLNKFKKIKSSLSRTQNTIIDYDEIINAIKQEKPQYRKRFLLKGANDTFETIQVDDIAYFYSLNKITFARLFQVQKNEQILDFSLESLHGQLNPSEFFRANRQYLININSINKIHQYFGNKLLIETKPKSDEKIIIGKDKVALFKRWLDR